MSRESAAEWTEGKRHVVIVSIVLPDRVTKDDIPGLIHVALRENFKLHPMEYHAYILSDFKLRTGDG